MMKHLPLVAVVAAVVLAVVLALAYVFGIGVLVAPRDCPLEVFFDVDRSIGWRAYASQVRAPARPYSELRLTLVAVGGDQQEKLLDVVPIPQGIGPHLELTDVGRQGYLDTGDAFAASPDVEGRSLALDIFSQDGVVIASTGRCA